MEFTAYKMRCTSCGEVFYELGNEEVDECPSCGVPLHDEERTEELSMTWNRLSVNHKTGVLKIEQIAGREQGKDFEPSTILVDLGGAKGDEKHDRTTSN